MKAKCGSCNEITEMREVTPVGLGIPVFRYCDGCSFTYDANTMEPLGNTRKEWAYYDREERRTVEYLKKPTIH